MSNTIASVAFRPDFSQFFFGSDTWDDLPEVKDNHEPPYFSKNEVCALFFLSSDDDLGKVTFYETLPETKENIFTFTLNIKDGLIRVAEILENSSGFSISVEPGLYRFKGFFIKEKFTNEGFTDEIHLSYKKIKSLT